MLNNMARYEASLMNGVIKTLTLLRALQAERAAAEAETNTIDGQPGKRNLTALRTAGLDHEGVSFLAHHNSGAPPRACKRALAGPPDRSKGGPSKLGCASKS
jgi:hypothetical protein